jgi:hypothetical protein
VGRRRLPQLWRLGGTPLPAAGRPGPGRGALRAPVAAHARHQRRVRGRGHLAAPRVAVGVVGGGPDRRGVHPGRSPAGRLRSQPVLARVRAGGRVLASARRPAPRHSGATTPWSSWRGGP